ncbi:uncharacterized protein CTHT_0066700 [Thermochaetoides thermophila DSM 1495]|uniref:ER membrane protein complex subunit 2 n=1 Tax=Chaetomium thermophilum (strain DSM 1495 / CBS 144.50 / IMI 039719) TaxID=759272 RepID=G0SGK9_CHATD|nr:hypothetical protein CTHT_0066700 [Thermochaetoides thermophila DSM 1495]EGS17348.1 hypothetical protein CTHT_0066700 [Thermochaetoides thermophila DSM 1495]
MAPLLFPPSQLSPAEALALSKKAPTVLNSRTTNLLSGTEKPEVWVQYENLVISCLRTGDDTAARKCLERLTERFGPANERVQALQGLYKEATAANTKELEEVLKEYEDILAENDTNIPIAKRRVSLLRSMGRVADATSALVQLLDFSPTDAEAWSELSDIYLSQGLYPQAIYAMEEVVVLSPNAWNIHARLGELHYMAAIAPGAGQGTAAGGSYQRHMVEAVKRFARSIELCDDYLRGYYGLKLVVQKLLSDETNNSAKQTDDNEAALPDTKTLERLHELATSKLAEIVRHYTANDRGWRGYNEIEIAAARELLAEGSPKTER